MNIINKEQLADVINSLDDRIRRIFKEEVKNMKAEIRREIEEEMKNKCICCDECCCKKNKGEK